MALLTKEQFRPLEGQPVEGETIYDVDGNAYVVKLNSAGSPVAILAQTVADGPIAYSIGDGFDCFSYFNPKAA